MLTVFDIFFVGIQVLFLFSFFLFIFLFCKWFLKGEKGGL